MPTTRANLNRSMIDGAGYATMVGIGEMYLPAFVLALSLGEVASGLIATLPPLVGACLQLVSNRGVRWLGSHKRWVVWSSAVQAAAFLPIIIGACLGHMSAAVAFAVVSLYYAGGMAAGAAWGTWIGTWVPRRTRARWFGRRLRLLQAATLCGFMGGGLILGVSAKGAESDADTRSATLLLLFAGLFVAAAISRTISVWYLVRQHEPRPLPEGHRDVPLRELLRRLLHGHTTTSNDHHDARLLGYMLAVSFAAAIGAPYVNPYLLEHLRFGYGQYAVMVGAVMAGKISMLAMLGRIAHHHGARRVLLIGGIGIAPIGLLWVPSANFWWLLGVQFYSGMVWACYDLGSFLLLLEHWREEERTSLVSVFYVFDKSAVAAGSIFGGWLLVLLGKDHAAYLWVFIIGAGFRLLTIVLLRRIGVRTGGDGDAAAGGVAANSVDSIGVA